MYMYKFVKTEEQAKSFVKAKKYGVVYKNGKRNCASKRNFLQTLAMAGKSEEFAEKYPIVICWNE